MSTQMIVKDKLGQEIKVGDYVVYRLSGRSGEIRYGKVTQIKPKTSVTGQLVQGTNGNLLVAVYVRGVRDYSWSTQKPEIEYRDSRLTKPECMVVYPTMPQEVRDLFTLAGL